MPIPRYENDALHQRHCECQECEPDIHAGCTSDCFIYDCTSPWACCNDQCDKGTTL